MGEEEEIECSGDKLVCKCWNTQLQLPWSFMNKFLLQQQLEFLRDSLGVCAEIL